MSGKVNPSPSAAESTETMQVYASRPADAGATHAGLVLLFAQSYLALAPAFVLRGEDVLIGRDPDADLTIATSAVSRHHARLRRAADGWTLTDLGGRNGTLVNGRFIGQVTLQHLDEIRIGDAIYKFVAQGAQGYARYRIDGADLGEPGLGRATPTFPGGRLVGGYQIQAVAAELRRAARSELSVMILGETGTGKEVLAEQLHDWSGRSGPFQAVNCAAIPATLIEGELFGHRRGAFSGADRDRPGLIRAARGGTLFLDEIGDMPLEAQSKLLRVIQSREVVPLGGSQPERVDVRFVCATHRDLARMQQEGLFRRDLFARLNELSVTLPPLRERKEDLLALCIALAARHGQPEVQVTFPFMTALIHHHFPYNVRELEALIKRWAATTPGPMLDVDALTPEISDRMRSYGARGMTPLDPLTPIQPPAEEAPPPRSRRPEEVEPEAAPPFPIPALQRGAALAEEDLRALLAHCHGNMAAVGRLVGKDRVQIHRWMKRYGIDAEEYR